MKKIIQEILTLLGATNNYKPNIWQGRWRYTSNDRKNIMDIVRDFDSEVKELNKDIERSRSSDLRQSMRSSVSDSRQSMRSSLQADSRQSMDRQSMKSVKPNPLFRHKKDNILFDNSVYEENDVFRREG